MNNIGQALIVVGIIAVVVYVCERLKPSLVATSSTGVTATAPATVSTAVQAPYEVTQVGSTTYVKMTSSGAAVESINLPNNAPVGTTGPR